MSTRNIAYWTTTGLVSFAFLASGIMKLVGAEQTVENMAQVGMPAWTMPLLGFWMVAAVVTLLAPGLGRVKEWAYAGVVFQMSGGFVGHLAVGDPFSAAAPALGLTALAVASYMLRPESRTWAPAPERANTAGSRGARG